MGTRADFYIGRGKDAEWIGSVAYDGYPDGVKSTGVFVAGTAEEFRALVDTLIAGREDGTPPKMGWPWPWESSELTDYAYAFDAGAIWASCFGREWFNVDGEEPEYNESGPKTVVLPNMKHLQKVTFGPRSGLLIFTSEG